MEQPTHPHPPADAPARIRPATRDDIEPIADLQVRMARETESLQLDRPTVVKGVTAVFDDPTHGRYWVGELDNAVAAVMLIIREWSDWRNADVLWIHSLYVVPEARGKGLFTQMYNALKQQVLDAPNLAGLRLYVEKNNAPARRIYSKLGMTANHYDLFEWLK